MAGLEAALALNRLAPDLIDVELLDPAEEFVYRPLLVAEPFGMESRESSRWHNRVVGYAFALVTDRYPPFRLSE